MRIALDIGKALDAHTDGIASYSRSLLHALPTALGDHQLTLCSLWQPADEATFRQRFPALSAIADLRFDRLPSASEVDILVSPVWIRPPTFDGPVLLVIHDLTFVSFPQHHTIDNRLHCLEGVLRAVAAGDPLLAVSQATADDVVERLGVERQRIDVAHPILDPSFDVEPGTPERALEQLRPLLGNTIEGYVLSVGSLEPRKNLHRLLEAHRQLPDQLGSRFPLIVVGAKGWKSATLRDELTDYAQSGRAQLLGLVDTEVLRQLYTAATVFVYPSLAEGFGLPVAEAMCCGAPVITSDCSSLPEVAGDAAVLVEPTNVEALALAIGSLLQDGERRAELRRLSLARAEYFDWRCGGERFIHAVEGALR